MKTIASLIALVACMVIAPASAQYADRASGRLVEISVVDRHSGGALPIYPWRGQSFVAGEVGQPYSLRLRNRTNGRVLVVVAVDGVNVVNGRTASARPSDGGYVLGPWESVDIAGWRKSLDHVAQFYFTSPSRSYAGQTGRIDQVGVIGAAVFEERYYQVPRPPVAIMQDSPAPSAPTARSAEGAMQSQRSIGTGHGQSEWSPATRTRFVPRSSRPAEVIRIDYDTPFALRERGIIVDPYRRDRWERRNEPRAFPGGFVPDP